MELRLILIAKNSDYPINDRKYITYKFFIIIKKRITAKNTFVSLYLSKKSLQFN